MATNPFKNLALISISILLMGGHVVAAEYSAQSELKVTAQHDDNVRLAPSSQPQTSIFGHSVRPKVDLMAREENWETSAVVDLRFNQYNREEYDSDDQYITLGGEYTGELNTLGATADLVRDSTLTSEVLSSGRIGDTAVRRESYTFSPYWSYMVGDSNQVFARLNYNEVDYKATGYSSYTYATGALGWTTLYSEETRFTVQLQTSEYKPESRGIIAVGLQPYVFGIESDSQTTDYSLLLGAEHALTETLNITANLGAVRSESEYDIQEYPGSFLFFTVDCDFYENTLQFPLGICELQDFSDTAFTGDVGLSWKTERNELKTTLSVANQPSSEGYVVQYQRISFVWSMTLTERASLVTELVGGSNEAVDESLSTIDPSNANRDFADFWLRYYHRLDEHWTVEAAGGYRWQEQESAPGDANGENIMLGISYQPQKWVW